MLKLKAEAEAKVEAEANRHRPAWHRKGCTVSFDGTPPNYNLSGRQILMRTLVEEKQTGNF